MMVFRLTEKLAKKLKEEPVASKEPLRCDPYLEWYASLFRFNRAQYVITMNAASLLTVVDHGRGITDDNSYLRSVLPMIGEMLEKYDCRLIFQRVIAPNCGKIRFGKTTDKSALGSMNRMIFTIKCICEQEEISPWDMGLEVNKMIWKPIDYLTPVEAFKRMKRE